MRTDKNIKKLVLLLIVVLTFSVNLKLNAQLKQPINPLKIEKIKIQVINPTSVGTVSYDRKYFNSVFEYSKLNEITAQWELKQTDEIYLFTLLINESIPYKEERIKVYPNEVTTNYENHNWLYGSYHTSETNDPIGTKMRISFYYKNGGQENLFASNHSIDIRNYRYLMTESMKMYFELKFVEIGIYAEEWLGWLKKTN